MEHATALVTDDATTTKCGCAKLVAAGWRVNCSACGRSEFTVGEWTGGEVVGLATTDGYVAPDHEDDPDDDDGTVEPYDVERDEQLVDEAERRVA